MKKLIPIIFLSLWMAACEDLPDDKAPGSLAGVYCILNPESYRQELTLIRAFNSDDFHDFTLTDTLPVLESGAEIILQCGIFEARMTETDSGHYADTAGIIRPEPGQECHLKIITNRNEILTASTIVPAPPSLTSPLPFDSFSVTLNVDTAENEMTFDQLPVTFNCSYDQYAYTFFYSLGGDSVRLFNPITQTYLIRKRFTLFQNNGLLAVSSFTLFDVSHPGEENFWRWNFVPEIKDSVLESTMELSVRAYNLKISGGKKPFVLSNIENGFGYFGAVGMTKQPVNIRITCRYR